VRVPNADAEVKFDLTGPAKIIGIGNGDLSNSEIARVTRTGRSKAAAGDSAIQRTGGGITVQASAPGLEPASVTLQSR